MANIWLRSSDGSDANPGTDKGSPKATLAAALTAAGAGGNVYVSDLHAESAAAGITITSSGTAPNPAHIICVEDWGAATGTDAPTTVSTGASVTTTGNNTITFTSGYATIYGVSFVAGSGATGTATIQFNTTSAFGWILKSCSLQLASTGISSQIILGGSGTVSSAMIRLINTTMSFNSTSHRVAVQRTRFEWFDTDNAIQGTAPTGGLFQATSTPSLFVLDGVDLSGLGANAIFLLGALSFHPRVSNCTLGASFAATTGSDVGWGGTVVYLANCDSGDTNYGFLHHCYAGVTTHETTIVRTGGASDGSTSFSRKAVTTADANTGFPVPAIDCLFWNDTIGEVTVSVETLTDNVTLTDGEAWVDVYYPGVDGEPRSAIASDAKASPLAAASDQEASTETWTTTGLTTPVTQKLSVTFTAREKGWVRVRAVLAKPSTTVYMCPKVLSDSAVQYMNRDGEIINAPASAAGGGGGGEGGRQFRRWRAW